MAGDAATGEQIERIRAGLGLDRPLVVQFGIWLGKVLSGDLGQSYYFRIGVTTLIGQRLEPTFALATLTMLIAIVVSIPLGVVAAWRFGGWFDRALMGFSVLGFSVPVFVLAYLLIWLVSLRLGWLPVQGYVRMSEGFFLFLKHLLLPAFTLSVIYMALIARVTRASVLETLGEDYVGTARAKGLSELRVLIRHALANAAVPIVTVTGLGLALLIRGVVVTESVYAIPGLGRLTVDAVLARDFPTIQGVILFFSLIYVAVNLLIDLSFVFLDLRIRHLQRAAELVGAHRGVRARVPACPGVGRPLAGHRRPDAVRCGEPGPASRPGGRDHDARGRGGEARVPDGLGLVRPRHLQPRALRHARVADRGPGRGAARARLRHRVRARRRVCALARRRPHARDGRHHGHPRHPHRHRRGSAVAREPDQRGDRHRHPRDPARHAPGALARADDPRGALRRGGGRARQPDAEDHVRPHPAQHRGAAAGAGHLHLRLRHPAGGDPLVPRRGPAARHPHLGQHHGRGPRAVRGLSAQCVLPRRVPRLHRAGGEYPRRRPARHPRPEDGEARMSALEVRDLTVALPAGADRKEAVSGVSFNVGPGEIVCLVGESGSGKSVIAQAIMGLLPQTLPLTGGIVRLEGEEITTAGETRRRELRGARMAMVFQEPMTSLNPVMTCGAQIDEVFCAHTLLPAAERRQRALALEREVALAEPERMLDSYPHQLSRGQRQRIGIAMALALEPALLIADEPTTALDVTTQAQILNLIAQLQQKHGMAVLFITHDFGVVAEIAHRVAVLREGRLVEINDKEKVLKQASHEYTRMLIRSVPALAPHERPPRPDAPVVLSVKGLSKTYAERRWLGKARRVEAASDVTLELRKGQTLGIVGESGSGKSTVAR